MSGELLLPRFPFLPKSSHVPACGSLHLVRFCCSRFRLGDEGNYSCPSSGTNMEAATEVCPGERAEKEAAALPSVLAWRLPGTGGQGGRRLRGVRSRARLSDLAAAGGETDCRRHWGSAHRGTRGPEGRECYPRRACCD